MKKTLVKSSQIALIVLVTFSLTVSLIQPVAAYVGPAEIIAVSDISFDTDPITLTVETVTFFCPNCDPNADVTCYITIGSTTLSNSTTPTILGSNETKFFDFDLTGIITQDDVCTDIEVYAEISTYCSWCYQGTYDDATVLVHVNSAYTVTKDFRYTNVDFIPYDECAYSDDIDVYTYGIGGINGTIEWTHTYDGSADPIYNATLTIVADDVDDGEDDEVYFNGHYLGLLNDMGYYTNWDYYPGPGNPGHPDAITTTVFTLDPAWINPSMPVTVEVETDWGVEIETSTLCVYKQAELGELLPMDDGNYTVDVVVKKNGKVSSTNPGQLYGVISIMPNTAISNVSILDTFGDFFDVNPAKLGGGVEILVIDADGGATILTDQPGIMCAVNNTANTVALDIDLEDAMGGPVEPGNTLMIYIKFQTAMKHETYPGDGSFENTATIGNWEVNATIEYAKKE